MNDITIIIPVAGIGKRMKSYGPKALLLLADGRTILRRQIDIFKSIFNNPEIIVVVGFDSEKIIKTLPDDIKIIENENFDKTGVGRSISLGLRATLSNNCIISYGDLVFNKATFEKLPNQSSILIDSNQRMTKEEVGVTIDDNNAIHFDYGLSTKWCHIVYLSNRELNLFKQISSQLEKRKLMGHEILNEVIDKGGIFKCVEPKKMKLVEIDSTKDLEKTKKVLL